MGQQLKNHLYWFLCPQLWWSEMNKKYRKNVAIVVFNKSKKLLICERIKEKGAWQFPQGGIDNGETPKDAALRELWEETSIKSAKLVTILDKPIRYEFPDDIRSKLWGKIPNNKYWGQDQYWVLLYVDSENEINLSTKIPEFANYKWDTAESAINSIVDFKKEAYNKALKLLKPYIDAYSIPKI